MLGDAGYPHYGVQVGLQLGQGPHRDILTGRIVKMMALEGKPNCTIDAAHNGFALFSNQGQVHVCCHDK